MDRAGCQMQLVNAAALVKCNDKLRKKASPYLVTCNDLSVMPGLVAAAATKGMTGVATQYSNDTEG